MKTFMDGLTSERILRIIARSKRLPVETLSIDSTFAELEIDSLEAIGILSEVEAEFNMTVSDDQAHSLRTIRDLVEMFQPKKGSDPSWDRHIYPQWPWFPLANTVRIVFLEGIAMPLVALLTAPREKKTWACEPDAPLLIVANHVWLWDVPLVLHALGGRTRRRVAVAMDGEMLLDWRRARGQGNWFMNLIAPVLYYLYTALLNVFPLPRTGDFRESFAHAARAMGRGFHVLVFPEGKWTKDGQMQAFERGAGVLWTELRCSALPMYLGGLWEAKGAPTKWFRSGRIYTHVGAVIPLDPKTDFRAATARLEEGVRNLQLPS